MEAAMPEQKVKVVVIDDEKDLGFLIQEILRKEGYEVFLTDDPQEGKEICVRESPQLVLLDYIMPKCYGIEVISFLRAQPQTAQTKVIMMSGLVMIRDNEGDALSQDLNKAFVAAVLKGAASGVAWMPFTPEQVAQYGIHAFLTKPFSRELLLEVVHKYLSE